jgi:hypothetical protein
VEGYSIHSLWRILAYSIAFWEIAEYIGTLLVIVGAIGEYFAEFRNIPSDECRRKRLEKCWARVLIVGLAIELLGLVRTSQLNSQIVATLNSEVAASDLARSKLEQSMMLRRLSKSQQEALCSTIPKSILGQVVVTSSSQDWESFRYASDFDEALRKCVISAGLQPSGGVGNSFWSQDVKFGVWIRYTKHFTLDDSGSADLVFNADRRKALAESIRDSLEKSGVKVEGTSDEGRSAIEVYVGPRFPPSSKDNPELPLRTNP